MKTRVDERLRREAVICSFRFACEDCAHAATKPVLRCSLGYPAAPRRADMGRAELEFCKEFELGGD